MTGSPKPVVYIYEGDERVCSECGARVSWHAMDDYL